MSSWEKPWRHLWLPLEAEQASVSAPPVADAADAGFGGVGARERSRGARAGRQTGPHVRTYAYMPTNGRTSTFSHSRVSVLMAQGRPGAPTYKRLERGRFEGPSVRPSMRVMSAPSSSVVVSVAADVGGVGVSSSLTHPQTRPGGARSYIEREKKVFVVKRLGSFYVSFSCQAQLSRRRPAGPHSAAVPFPNVPRSSPLALISLAFHHRLSSGLGNESSNIRLSTYPVDLIRARP